MVQVFRSIVVVGLICVRNSSSQRYQSRTFWTFLPPPGWTEQLFPTVFQILYLLEVMYNMLPALQRFGVGEAN